MCGIEGHQSTTGHGILVCRTRQGGTVSCFRTRRYVQDKVRPQSGREGGLGHVRYFAVEHMDVRREASWRLGRDAAQAGFSTGSPSHLLLSLTALNQDTAPPRLRECLYKPSNWQYCSCCRVWGRVSTARTVSDRTSRPSPQGRVHDVSWQ